MGLATHAIALALGYALGNPQGRARLVALRGRAGEAAKEASRRPEVKQAREKAWDLAGEAGVAVRNRLTTRSRRRAAEGATGTGTSTGTGTPTAANGRATTAGRTAIDPDGRLAGTTVAQDSRAAVLGSATPDLQRPERPAQR